MPRRSLALAIVLTIGCAPASEATSLHLFVDGEGARVGVYAGSSAAGVDVELEWAMQVDNRTTQPCPVAVYRWVDALPEGASLPSPDPADSAWPTTWDGGELIDSGVVEAGAPLLFGPAMFDEAERVDALFGLAVCPGADLELDVRAEVFAELGVRSISEALSVELWRAG